MRKEIVIHGDLESQFVQRTHTLIRTIVRNFIAISIFDGFPSKRKKKERFMVTWSAAYHAMIWNLIQLDAFIRIGILVKHIFTMSPTFAAIYTIRNAQPLINDSHGGLVVRCYGGCGWKMNHLKFVAGMRNLECDEGLIGAFFIAFVRQNRAQ